jgi:hypothetical protein
MLSSCEGGSFIRCFPVSDPEIVFKFRHPDFERPPVDLRPSPTVQIKFKAEVPLRDQLGGYRLLYL